jgi:hypothetical protein
MQSYKKKEILQVNYMEKHKVKKNTDSTIYFEGYTEKLKQNFGL